MSTRDWRRIARRQCGVISYSQLVRCGLTRHQINTLTARRELLRPSRGVFRSAASPATYEAHLWWATLATGGTLGFATACHQWDTLDEPGPCVDVVLGPDRPHRPLPGVRVWRRPLLTKQITTRNGLPITTRACSILDHLGTLGRSDAVQFADRAMQQRWIGRTDIERRLENAAGRTGNTRLREVLRITADGAAAESERILHRLLRDRGITGWTPNFEVRTHGRLVAVLDVAFAEFRLGIEVDGLAFHSSATRFQRDRTRQNVVQNLGWRILRFTWADLVDRPDEVIATILRAIQSRYAG